MSAIPCQIRVKIIPYKDSRFNSKVVLLNLEEILNERGITVRGVETRESGRGTPIATRATIEGLSLDSVQFQSTIEVIVYQDSHFTHKVIIGGLENTLEEKGCHIIAYETRQGGQGTPIAIRSSLVMKLSR